MPRLIMRLTLLVVPLAGGAGAIFFPAWQRPLIILSIGLLLAVGVSELFWPGLERFVGQRYLRSSRQPKRAFASLVATLALTAAGLALFFLARKHEARGWGTLGGIAALVRGLGSVLSVALQALSAVLA